MNCNNILNFTEYCFKDLKTQYISTQKNKLQIGKTIVNSTISNKIQQLTIKIQQLTIKIIIIG